MTLKCPDCEKHCVDSNALFQHRKWKHRAKADDNPKPPRQELFPKSRALIAETMEAAVFEIFDVPAPGLSLDEIAGEPLEDWEKPYAY